ncbi:hypothetical protein QI212_02160 [Staphylococcus saprophyticus]|uniref:hypothetical protein n=1 Tax=Staphylococcus sp. 231237_7MaSpsaltlick TaxID=3367518 RepID=UPI002978E82E|nr:hypothetical protein [Staphylococcus saprophyticus]
MTLEAIMTEIRDELKRSNDLKEKQLQDFTDISNEPAGWTQLPTEEEKQQPKEAPAKEAPAKEEPIADESEMKKAVAKIIKGTDTEKKTKLKAKINEIGAKKVSDIQPEQRQSIIDYVAELDNA